MRKKFNPLRISLEERRKHLPLPSNNPTNSTRERKRKKNPELDPETERKLRVLKLTTGWIARGGKKLRKQRRGGGRSLARRGAFRDYPVKTCVSSELLQRGLKKSRWIGLSVPLYGANPPWEGDTVAVHVVNQGGRGGCNLEIDRQTWKHARR